MVLESWEKLIDFAIELTESLGNGRELVKPR